MCHRCWQRVESVIRPPRPRLPLQEVNDEPQAENATAIYVPEYSRAPNTTRHCIFNNCRNINRYRIPEVIKIYTFCEHKLYIPFSARVCQEHLEGNIWDELPQHCNVTHDFNAAQFRDISDIMRRGMQRGSRLDFNTIGAVTSEEMHFWTGRSFEQFEEILEQTPSLSQRCKNPRTALGIFLTKLRTGESNERLATLFNMSRQNLERLTAIARVCLTSDYVDRHLGLDHINRDHILRRNLMIPHTLFGNNENTKAILICDGTYIYIQKSANFLFQRQSYSLHKFQNLLKPFLVVTTDGYIIDVMGPYAATKTDANIMSDIMNNGEHPIHCLLERNDVFILDRGFRDSLDDIEACGYEYHVPPSKHRHESQLTTDQANESRLVTICRWVVEVVNGRFKRDFKLFRQKYFNNALPHMFADFRIAAAIINRFHIPIDDSEYAEAFITEINQRLHTPTILYDYVERKRLNSRRADFTRVEESDIDFPRFSEEQIIKIALGTYQVKLAKSYCSEHLQNGLYSIEIYREAALEDLPNYGINEDAWLLRGRIQSRHVRARKYYCYLLVHNNNIVQRYCTCITGRRTVGTCAHILSIIWYLGYAIHEGFVGPALFLNDVIVDVDN